MFPISVLLHPALLRQKWAGPDHDGGQLACLEIAHVFLRIYVPGVYPLPCVRFIMPVQLSEKWP